MAGHDKQSNEEYHTSWEVNQSRQDNHADPQGPYDLQADKRQSYIEGPAKIDDGDLQEDKP